jgi:hypothetical protein
MMHDVSIVFVTKDVPSVICRIMWLLFDYQLFLFPIGSFHHWTMSIVFERLMFPRGIFSECSSLKITFVLIVSFSARQNLFIARHRRCLSLLLCLLLRQEWDASILSSHQKFVVVRHYRRVMVNTRGPSSFTTTCSSDEHDDHGSRQVSSRRSIPTCLVDWRSWTAASSPLADNQSHLSSDGKSIDFNAFYIHHRLTSSLTRIRIC